MFSSVSPDTVLISGYAVVGCVVGIFGVGSQENKYHGAVVFIRNNGRLVTVLYSSLSSSDSSVTTSFLVISSISKFERAFLSCENPDASSRAVDSALFKRVVDVVSLITVRVNEKAHSMKTIYTKQKAKFNENDVGTFFVIFLIIVTSLYFL